MMRLVQLFILRFPPYLFLSLLVQTTIVYPLLSFFTLSQFERLCFSIFWSVFVSAFLVRLLYQIFIYCLKVNLKFHLKRDDFFLICFCGVIGAFVSYTFVRLLFGGLIVFFTILQIQRFMRQMRIFLAPHRYVTEREVFIFILFFVELIILFTLINLLFSVPQNPVIHVSEDMIAGHIHLVKPQNIMNALYFTVITMTTVGYGDFIPLTYYGKILVVSECLTSYIIFGLMIGLIVRGIHYPKPKKRISIHSNQLKKRQKKF